MDLTLLQKAERGGICYKLFKANFHYDHYVILAQTKDDFYCGSFSSTADRAREIFFEISESETDVFCIADILSDLEKEIGLSAASER